MVPCTADPGAAALINVASAAGQFGRSRSSVNAVSRPLATDIVNVGLTQSISPASAQAGQAVRCTITLNNSSSVPIRCVRVAAPDLAEALDIRAVSVNGCRAQGACLGRGVSVPAVGAGGQAVVTVDAVVPRGISGTVTSTARAGFTLPSANGSARLTTASNTVSLAVAAPGLEVEKSADRSFVTPEDNVVAFTLTVRNTGACPIDNVVVTDSLPEGLTYVAGSARVNGCPRAGQDPAGGISLGTLQAGEAAAVTFRARADV